MTKFLKGVFSILFLFISINIYSQDKQIIIKRSDLSYADEEKYPGATIFIGNVIMQHEGAELICQKAFFYQKENFFKALGNVIINQGDTIRQTSNYADYNGNSKLAVSWGNVILKDPKMVLTTDTLYFNRKQQRLLYDDFATIRDETNTLTSVKGTYYLENKKFTAVTDVKIVSPDNIIDSERLDYFTNSGFTYLYGPSNITNTKDNNRIYTERGFYNTKTDISHFTKNSTLYLDNREIKGDSLYYDKIRGFASATNNIRVIDTAQNFVAKSNYAEFFQKIDSIFMTKRAVAISVLEQDSLYVHGDTLLVTGKKSERIIRSYHDVQIFKSDLQGKCDSLHTNQKTGLTRMFFSPALWAQKSQITGDSIHFITNKKTEKLDSLKVLGNSFIIQQDSINPFLFNQIKGRNMYGKFIDNELKRLLVKGNGEAVNHNRNNFGVLETITRQLCSNIEFEFKNKEISTIKCLNETEGRTFPPSMFPEEYKQLRGFLWRIDEQPKVMEDIFIPGKSPKRKNNPFTRVKKKAILTKEKNEVKKPKMMKLNN